MSSTVMIWALLVIAIVAANLPWFSDKIFAIKEVENKKFSYRLLEWFSLYFLVGSIALGIETKLNGIRHDQGWEFYVVTLCLFLVFALPGFIYQIDLKRHFATR
ncbi:MAG: DUF2818 family protein [Gammaproteobacteria bacterium]|nr:DUF2818 family protein [Gammaproteobacteria bacterium]